MGVALALLAAVVYGAGDFLGGLASKRTTVFTVVPISGLFGLITAIAAVPIFSPGPPSTRDLELGAIIGVIGAGAIAFLYQGLAVARMSVVAPITAVVAAVVPVTFGLIIGERPGAGAIVGILLALVAVALVSSASDEDVTGQPEPRRSGIVESLISGIGFGLLYVVLSQTSHGMWPLVAARTVSVLVVAIAAVAAGKLAPPARGSLGTIAFSGILDMGGNVFYLLALRHTLISVAAVVTSLYPASTVVLARIVLREKFNRVQWIGVACAAAGLVLIARG